MRGSILKQSLSTLLTASLFVQLSLGTSLALGQSNTNPLAPNDPFWSNTGVNPTNSNFWFNSPTDPANPGGNDPWGNWTDGGGGTAWGSNTTTNGWDQSFNSGVSDYSGLGSFGYGYGNTRPTDPYWLQLMRMSGIVDKNYTKTVNDLRTKYGAFGAEDNDALANKVILHSSLVTGGLAGAAGIMGRALQYVGANEAGAGGMGFGYYMGMVTGYLADFMTVILEEANMIYSLQEIYGELSPDPDERAASAIWPFILGMTGTGLNKFMSDKLLISPPPAPNPDPNPLPIPPDPNVPPSVFADSAVPNADKATAEAAVTDAKKAVASVRTVEARREMTSGFMKFFKRARMSHRDLENETNKLLVKSKAPEFMTANFPKVFSKFKDPASRWLATMRKWPVFSRVAVSYFASTGFNAVNCASAGILAKYLYKSQHKFELAHALELMRATPKAVAVVWLVLLRDVFQEFEVKDATGRNHHDDARMYAAIMQERVPLWRYNNERGYRDDLMTILDDYKKDPKLVDEYLGDLQTELSIDGKLEIIKDIYAGMLMKGMPTKSDLDTIGNVAAGLGLRPPVYVKVPTLDQMLANPSPTNIKIDHLQRYLNLINYLNLVAQDRAQDKVTPGMVKAKRWRIGQLIWTEAHDADAAAGAKILDDVQKHGGVLPQDKANAQALSDKMIQNMGQTQAPNVVNNDDLFKEFQQKPTTTSPQSTSTVPPTTTVPPDPFAVPSSPTTPPPATTTTAPAPTTGASTTGPTVPTGTPTTTQVKPPPAKVVPAPIPPAPTSNPNT